jgi:hypothetical protein
MYLDFGVQSFVIRALISFVFSIPLMTSKAFGHVNFNDINEAKLTGMYGVGSGMRWKKYID